MNKMVDIHADDYGYSINTSKDILDCIKAGKLDSFSIMPNMYAFEESMDMLYKEIPNLPFLPLISIHINIPEGYFDDDVFPMSWVKLFLSSYSPNRNAVKKALEIDLKKQIEKGWLAIKKCIDLAEKSGIEHKQKGMRLDSHIHTHLIPVVWDSLMSVIKEEKYEVEYIRNPKEPIIPFLKNASLIPSYGLANIIKNRILMLYSGKADRFCEKNNVDKMYMWGLAMSGKMDYERIKQIYPEMIRYCKKRNRRIELLFHPGRATENEKNSDMDKDYFPNANLSENRSIEKNAVMHINEIVD